MKILYKKAKKSETPVNYSVSLNNGVLTLGFEIERNGKPFKGESSLKLSTHAGRIYEVDVIETDEPNAVILFPVFENNAWCNKAPTKMVGRGDVRVARIAVSTDGNDCVIQLSRPTVAISGLECIEKNEGMTEVAHFMLHSDVVKHKVEREKLRSSLFNELDSSDSIAYLEAQIDALTRYILSDKTDKDAFSVLKIADACSVMECKPIDKIVAEFKHKENVRKQQTKYYETVKSYKSQNGGQL